MKAKEIALNGVAVFNRMSKKGKIITGVVAFGVVGSLLGFGDSEEIKPIEPAQQVQAKEQTEALIEKYEKEYEEAKEPVKEEPQYTTEKTFIHDDPSSYSGQQVYEIEVYGEFDLDSPSLKQDALKILNKEAEIGLQEQPTSVMVRVFVYQGENYEYLPIVVGTFDVAGGKLSLRDLPDKTRYPIFNQLNK